MSRKLEKVTLVYMDYGEPRWAEVGSIKRGRKYVYFLPNNNGDVFDDRIIKLDMSKCLIFPGARPSIIRKVEEFKKQVREWREKEEEFRRELDSKIYEIRRKYEDEWADKNPYPTFKPPRT